MKEWNYEKLEQMTQQENEFVQIRLNYRYIAENYEEMFLKTYENGDLKPTMFEDVNIAYPGKAENDIKIPEVDQTITDKIKDKKQKRKMVEIKHFSRDLNHEAWFNHLEDEVKEFIEKYPEYENVIL